MWKNNSNSNCDESICKAMLVDGQIVEYDMAISVDRFVKTGLTLGNYPKFVFLGEGKIYSVDEFIQKMNNKSNDLFFIRA